MSYENNFYHDFQLFIEFYKHSPNCGEISIHLSADEWNDDKTKLAEELCSTNHLELNIITGGSSVYLDLNHTPRHSEVLAFSDIFRRRDARLRSLNDLRDASADDLWMSRNRLLYGDTTTRRVLRELLARCPLSREEFTEAQPMLVFPIMHALSDIRDEFPIPICVPLQNFAVPAKSSSEFDDFTSQLPVRIEEDMIMRIIDQNKITIISAATGSGKTTQVPQMILERCHREKTWCRMYCTQPRRISATSIAERVARERGEPLGDVVGYSIRYDHRANINTLLTFCTSGILMKMLISNDTFLTDVSHIIIDEVHERTRHTDLIMAILRLVIDRFPNLKVIIMSATLNADQLSAYFGGEIPVVNS